MPDTIRCPQCGTEVELGEALTARVREEVRGQVLAQVKAREAAAAAQALEAQRLREQAQGLLADAERQVAAQVAARLEAQRAEAQRLAREAVARDLRAGEDRLAALRLELQGAQQREAAAKKAELELRGREEALQREKADLDLTVLRRIGEERARLQQDARKAAAEEQALKQRETEATIEGLRRTIDELKRKAEQGSQQLQGEVLETSLEESLRRAFPTDLIEPVPKGVRGADVVQHVRTAAGRPCGIVLWESKRTKAWQADWLEKLRDDMRALRADVCALVTQTLPRDAAPLTLLEDVWVTGFGTWLGLAHALRKGLVDVAEAHRTHEGQGGKMEAVYAYLTGGQFAQRVKGFLEPLQALKKDLDAERAAMERLWAKREKQLERTIASLAGLRGDMEGLAGDALPGLPALDLPAPDEPPGT